MLLSCLLPGRLRIVENDGLCGTPYSPVLLLYNTGIDTAERAVFRTLVPDAALPCRWWLTWHLASQSAVLQIISAVPAYLLVLLLYSILVWRTAESTVLLSQAHSHGSRASQVLSADLTRLQVAAYAISIPHMAHHISHGMTNPEMKPQSLTLTGQPHRLQKGPSFPPFTLPSTSTLPQTTSLPPLALALSHLNLHFTLTSTTSNLPAPSSTYRSILAAMDSPMQQDSPPPAVKQEQQEDVNMPTYTTEPDYINLLSDDEDAMDSPTTNLPPRRLASPFKENAALPTTSGPVDLGFSLFSTNPTDAQPSDQDAKPKVLSDAIKQRLRDRQKELAQKLKKRTPVAESPGVQTPIGQPLGANSNATSPLFVTQRTEDNTPTAETPVRPAIDPAKQYTALHRAYAKKKKSGKITVEEEIEFIRAESDERARIERERREGNFDEMESPEPEREPGLEDDYVLDYNALNVPGFELSDDDEPEEPKKKGGRKRKAGDEDSAPPKKRGRPTKAEKAARGKEKDVLELVRDKVTAKKAHGKKAGGKAAAGKGKGKGKKYKGPSMMNQGSMFGSNVFKDAEKIKDLADQPTFEGTHQRGNALKQLIAEVPAEKKRLAQVDRRYLEQAIQSFTGRTSLRPAEDGTWHLKGMKVTLKH